MLSIQTRNHSEQYSGANKICICRPELDITDADFQAFIKTQTKHLNRPYINNSKKGSTKQIRNKDKMRVSKKYNEIYNDKEKSYYIIELKTS